LAAGGDALFAGAEDFTGSSSAATENERAEKTTVRLVSAAKHHVFRDILPNSLRKRAWHRIRRVDVRVAEL
jgi:hypothetical protein